MQLNFTHTQNSLQLVLEFFLCANSSLMTKIIRLQLQSVVCFTQLIPLRLKIAYRLSGTDNRYCVPTKYHICTSLSITCCHSNGWMGEERVENQIALFFALSAHGYTRMYTHTHECIRMMPGITKLRAETIEARNGRASRDA